MICVKFSKTQGAIKMKKLTIGLLLAALVSLGTMFAFGQQNGGNDGKRMRRHHGKRGHFRIMKNLDLTDAQKEQIKAIRQAGKEKTKNLRESLKANRQQLQEITANGQFNEAQIQAIAAQQSGIMAQLIVEKTRVKSQIYNILTADQKAKIEEMKAEMQERRQNRKANRGAKRGGATDDGNF